MDPPFQRLLAHLEARRLVRTQGLRGAARGHLLARAHRALKRPLVCVTPDEASADRLATDLAFFLGGAGSLLEPRVLRLPVDEVLPWDELSQDADTMAERLGALFHLRAGTAFPALVLSVRALHRKVLPPDVVARCSVRLEVGGQVDRDRLARKLTEMGYASSPLVEDLGTFSVRGEILDLFCPLYTKPLRIELFGDSVESLRLFDPDSQRTLEVLQTAQLVPARELILDEDTQRAAEATLREAAERIDLPTSQLREKIERLREGLPEPGMEALLPGLFGSGLRPVFEYLPTWSSAPLFYLDDPVGLERAAEELGEEIAQVYAESEARGDLSLPPEAHFVSREVVRVALDGFDRIEGGGLSFAAGPGDEPILFPYETTSDLREAIRTHKGEEGALSPLVERLARWRDRKVACAIACGTPGQADRLKKLLLERDLVTRIRSEPFPEAASDPAALFDASVWAHLFPREISEGFVDAAGGLALLSDEEIFGERARRKVRTPKVSQPFTQAFRELKEGDLVVHTDFGIARYGGLSKMEVEGIPGDFLILEYAGKDKVYLPVSRMRLIQKFTGGDPEHVQLDKLGGQSWEKTKKRVKEHLLKMAAELLRLYAARKAHPGTAFSGPDRYYRQFEADFEFETTPDQAKAVDDVLTDMAASTPMDRLVCGDVGYGKTEVAMRAAFKAVLDHKQVAVLVPTTVLAQQHLHTFQARFEGYPVTIEAVSRMRKPAEVREILRRAKAGTVDILIGTHKLLGAEVGFKDLGLLVVDEEQRFGVKHKERIKQLKTQVDVLTLTATPIPRTLNMAMSGLRDMSIIATPPQDRRAIRTFVTKFDKAQVREAILREVQRGGQVFFIHNRVQSIHAMARTLEELVPEVTFGVAHGQMGEGQLEKVMTEFVERKFQVLISTSILESGIDIPSANTMIVDRADTFGLAQLYQLRGRVGRSKERAYAYLMVPSRRTVTREAQRRLEVLSNFTELGAGFSIASHDLEIRGAGNLLGPDQSGAIAAIGFDLYTELLEEAVAEMRGEPPPVEIEPEVKLPLAALIPDDYVPDVHQRLLLYKRFSVAATPDELSDLRAELVDRYGELPDEVDHLCETTLLKIELRDLRLRAVERGPGRLIFSLGTEARLDAGKLARLVQHSEGAYRLTPEMKLVTKVPERTKGLDWVSEAKKVLRDLSRLA